MQAFTMSTLKADYEALAVARGYAGTPRTVGDRNLCLTTDFSSDSFKDNNNNNNNNTHDNVYSAVIMTT